MSIDVRVSTLIRDGGSDERLGRMLVDACESALLRGGAPAAALAVGPERLSIVPLAPFAEARWPFRSLLVSLCSEAPGDVGETEAVGIIGQFQRRRSPDDAGVPVATVFLEWPDGRWWHWLGLVSRARVPTDDGADRELPVVRDGTAAITRAIDGLPRPEGLGGWWTMHRHRPLHMSWDRREPAGLVH